MRVVFSRKGFDSSSGGCPSPIIDDQPVSIPIPATDRSTTAYGDIELGNLVSEITNGRYTKRDLCHYDPMFESNRCAFGQVGAAQSHLTNQGVGVGDVFLFFGLFAGPGRKNPHHRIFGYLEVEKIRRPNQDPSMEDQPQGFTQRHPHTLGHWSSNNTIYIGKGCKTTSTDDRLRLSSSQTHPSLWQIPAWLKQAGLSYHADPARWQKGNLLQSVKRGQEFVTKIEDNIEANDWLAERLDLMTATAY